MLQTSSADTASAGVIEREARHAPGLYSQTVAFVRGEGVRLYDDAGRAYLDFMAGIGVASIGHANPRLTAALTRQAERLVVCPQSQANDVRAEFLERLCAVVGAEAHVGAGTATGPLSRVYLSNSGSEANEAALKWARAATGRRRIVAAKRGFAGRTLGSLALTWEPAYRMPFSPLPNEVEWVSFGDPDELAAAVDDDTAAFVVEPIQGEGGVHPAPDGYLAFAREVTAARGALLVCDEIQCGVGRTGSFLVSGEATPDIVTLAKGLAGGVPIGATLMTPAVADAMPRGGHGTTFGGNPLACAAGLAVLAEIEERDLLGNAAAMGGRLMAGLQALVGQRVRQVRGRGLMVGMELRERAAPVVARLRDRGLLTVAAGANVIRFLPPLIVGPADVDEALRIVSAELAA